jgi:LuxR family maltose regulon positive regulatory protein
VYDGDFSPNVRPVPALRARLLTAQGDLGGALGWARQQGISAEDDLSYLRECEHITLARILLAEHGAQHTAERSEDRFLELSRLLERLLAAAEEGGRAGSVIEILVLQAIAHRAGGDVAGAVATLERALTMAEPEGYARVFVGEGPPMTSLLLRVAKGRDGWAYVRHLLDAATSDGGSTPGTQPVAPTRQGLVEPLSDRELDVLRLLGSELDGPAIARELTVSLNTLRTHTKHIYAKLGVTSRRAAVRQAAELNLLSHTR